METLATPPASLGTAICAASTMRKRTTHSPVCWCAPAAVVARWNLPQEPDRDSRDVLAQPTRSGLPIIGTKATTLSALTPGWVVGLCLTKSEDNLLAHGMARIWKDSILFKVTVADYLQISRLLRGYQSRQVVYRYHAECWRRLVSARRVSGDSRTLFQVSKLQGREF